MLEILIELSGTEKSKFISLFILSLEEREQGETECYKETEYKARLLSHLISSENNSIKENAKDLLEKLIIAI